MFRKMFGGTELEQYNYLLKMVILTAVSIIAAIVICLISGNASGTAIIAILALIWAWSFMKAWFGWTTFGALFTGNVIFGVIIFLLYIFVGYILGLIAMLIGIGRFIYLCVKRSKVGLEG